MPGRIWSDYPPSDRGWSKKVPSSLGTGPSWGTGAAILGGMVLTFLLLRLRLKKQADVRSFTPLCPECRQSLLGRWPLSLRCASCQAEIGGPVLEERSWSARETVESVVLWALSVGMAGVVWYSIFSYMRRAEVYA